MAKLEKLLPWLVATVASYAGWYLGSRGGIFLSFTLSMIGFAAGVYFGRKWVRENL